MLSSLPVSAARRSEPEPRTLPDYYRILGVSPTADPSTLRRAFRELSKQYHPDTTSLPADEATRKFQSLKDAYSILTDPSQRQSYDLARQRPSSPAPAPRPRPTIQTASNAYLDAKDRALSPGELFALFLLALTFVVSLVLAIGLGLARGEALLRTPSWLQPSPAVETLPSAEATPVAVAPADGAAATVPSSVPAVTPLPQSTPAPEVP